jgi:carbohydrate-binding DOMON domain-containing protein
MPAVFTTFLQVPSFEHPMTPKIVESISTSIKALFPPQFQPTSSHHLQHPVATQLNPQIKNDIMSEKQRRELVRFHTQQEQAIVDAMLGSAISIMDPFGQGINTSVYYSNNEEAN